MIHIYERNKSEPFRQKPDKAARETNYYSIRKADDTYDDSVESFLSAVESDAIPVLSRLANENIHLPWEDRGKVAFFVALQELRVPWARDNAEKAYGELIRRISQMSAHFPDYYERILKEMEEKGEDLKGVTADSLREFIDRDEYTIEVDPILSLQTMLQVAPELHRRYIEMKWTILRALGGFVTSDNPVVRHDPEYRGGFYGLGLASRTVEINFPISKNACLVITHDRNREDRWHELMATGEEEKAKELRRTVPTIEYTRPSAEIVNRINGMTVAYADRFVFSPVQHPGIPQIFTGKPKGFRIQVG